VTATQVEQARDALAAARVQLASAETDLQRAVATTLATGVPATTVAEILGVTRARVYQIRDGRR
jgi:DNA-binding CsgD family transcriptional regulator